MMKKKKIRKKKKKRSAFLQRRIKSTLTTIKLLNFILERERKIYTNTYNAPSNTMTSFSAAAEKELKKVREELVKIKRDWESQSLLLSEKNEELSVSMRNGEALERELKRVKVERKREEEERDGWKREEGKMKVSARLLFFFSGSLSFLMGRKIDSFLFVRSFVRSFVSLSFSLSLSLSLSVLRRLRFTDDRLENDNHLTNDRRN
jgi:hypothetical protein